MYDDQTTIAKIYERLNTIPAQLAAKGKREPEATILIAANSRMTALISWSKNDAKNSWNKDTEYVTGDTVEEIFAKVEAFLASLPSAEEAKLNEFTANLGRLIDSGREVGIDVNYLNPLVETMKRLSENAITYKPLAKEI